MTIEESERHLLHERAAQAMGVEAAAVLMSHLPPAGWAELARRSDVEHETALLRADLATARAETSAESSRVGSEIRTELGAVRTELKDDMAILRTELKDDMAILRTELKDDMASLRTELKDAMASLRIELKGDMVTQTRWMISVLGVLGAIYTAANMLTRKPRHDPLLRNRRHAARRVGQNATKDHGGAPPSVRAAAAHDGTQRLGQDQQVLGDRPVLDVEEVEAHAVLPRQV